MRPSVKTFLILGLAYWGGVKEGGFYSAFLLARELNSRGARPIVHDPLYSHAEIEARGSSIAPGPTEGTRATANLRPDYVANLTNLNVLHRPVNKDHVARQVVAFCGSDSVSGQTFLIDCGRLSS